MRKDKKGKGIEFRIPLKENLVRDIRREEIDFIKITILATR